MFLARLRTTLVVITVAGFVTGSILTWSYFSAQRKVAATAKARAQSETQRFAKTIDNLLREAEPIAKQVAESAGNRSLDGSELENSLESNRDLSGVGVAYEPNASPSGERLFAPYYTTTRNGEPPRLIHIESLYDYTKFENRWYSDPMLDGAMWSPPHSVEPKGPMVVGYCAPFAGTTPAEPGEEPAPGGLAIADISLSRISALVDSMNLGRSGYGMVFAEDGRYVSHPRNEFVTSGKTVFDDAWGSGDTVLYSLAIRGIRGERGVVDRVDPITGQLTWVFYESIPAAHWTLAAVFFRDDLREDANLARRSLIRIAVAYLIAVMAFGAFIVSRRSLTVGSLWLLSALFGLMPAAGIAAVWYVSDIFPRLEARQTIVDGATLERYLKTYLRESEDTASNSHASFVRTGIFIKSVEFTTSGSNVKVNGYIWQRYEKGVQDSLTRGVLLPDADNPKLTEIYRRDDSGFEVVGWDFSADLREDFYYETYPLDRQEVWVKMIHPDFHQKVFLIPDLESYTITNPFARPGVNSDLVLPGWTVVGSYFDFRLANYSANFGHSSFNENEQVPELYFNALVRRNILEPFISRIIPLLVALSMLFAMLLIGSKSHERRAVFGFTAMDVLLGCSGLFFVVIFAHMSLREALSPSSIMYFEYFYFATYVAFLFVSINSILFASHLNIKAIQYEDNLIPKLVFWPVFTSVLMAVTVLVFY